MSDTWFGRPAIAETTTCENVECHSPGANTTCRWQVRIEWVVRPPTTYPRYTFDTKESREDAEYCARHAMSWKKSDDALYVVEASVRGPGATDWEAVTLPHVVAA